MFTLSTADSVTFSWLIYSELILARDPYCGIDCVIMRCRVTLRGLLMVAVAGCLAFTFFELGRRSNETFDDIKPPRGRRPGDAGVHPPRSTRVAGPTDALGNAFTDELCAVDRVKTHVSTDKPIYRPGETVRFRGVLVNAKDMGPLTPARGYVQPPMVEIRGPRGDTIVTLRSSGIEDSVASAEWTIPPDLPGGDYVAHFRTDSDGFAPAQRGFNIRAFSNPLMRLQLKFARDGYGPSDRVTASITAHRAAGGVPEGAVVSGVARLDGNEIWRGEGSALDPETGKATVSFELPKHIARGEGSLTVIVRDGGISESTTKTLPVVVSDLDIDLLPESGHLVAGLPTRVYAEVRAHNGEPADIIADIVAVHTNAGGTSKSVEAVASLNTVHEGRGVSEEFTPRANVHYELRISHPATLLQPKPLPPVKSSGPWGVVSLPQGTTVLESNDAIDVTAGALEAGTYRVGIYRREKEIGSAVVELPGAAADGTATRTVSLTPPRTPEAEGVLRVTLSEAESDRPVAERLIFRKPSVTMDVEVVPIGHDAAAPYAPGDAVELEVRTSIGGNPVPAIVGLTVTDDSLLQMVERRRWAPRLPAMAWLEDEVMHLEDADAYLADTFAVRNTDPLVGTGANGELVEPSVALDLLLATQGWRQFVYADPLEFLEAPEVAEDPAAKDRAERLMAVHRGPQIQMLKAGFAGGGMGVPMGGMPRARGAPMPEAMPQAMPMMAAAAADGGPAMEMEAAMAFAAPPDMELDGADAAVVADMDMAVPPPAAPDELHVAEAGLARQHEEPLRMDGDGNIVGGDEMMAPPMEPILAGDMIQGDMADFRRPAGKMRPPQGFPMMPVRVYRHQRSEKQTDTREDFTSTVYWAAGIRTNKDGVARVSFELSDSITTMRVLADAFHAAGRPALGVATSSVEVDRPFYTMFKLPTEVTFGDRFVVGVSTVVTGAHGKGVPVSIATQTSGSLHLVTEGQHPPSWQQETRSVRTDLDAIVRADGDETMSNDASVTVAGFAGPHAVDAAEVWPEKAEQTPEQPLRDVQTQSLRIVPAGFPISISNGGMASAGSSTQALEIEMPNDVMEGSVAVDVHVYPSPVASLTQALEALIQQPCGCFEQTSSTTYPLVMAQKYFKTHAGVDPEIIDRAGKMLADGYKKLISFESEGGGFEWFGGTPAHEALTAYGALQFHDMADVFDVDSALLERTRTWLRSRRDGDGGFLRNSRSLDSFGRASEQVTNAYIVWSLTAAGDHDLDAEVARLLKDVDDATGAVRDADSQSWARDPYFVGLVAGSLFNIGDAENGHRLAQRLVNLQDESTGALPGAGGSITCSGGASLDVETTAIAVLVWLNDDHAYAASTERAMEWLVSQCQNGRFGSTQATVLALKAIVEYDVRRAAPKGEGDVTLRVDGRVVDSVQFDGDSHGALSFDGEKVLPLLSAGNKHKLEIEMTSSDETASMPFSAQVTYNSPLPTSAERPPITIFTSLNDAEIHVGEATEMRVEIENTSDKPAPMTVAIIGIPGGLDVRREHLRELIAEGKIAFFEELGRDLVLYWRGMAPSQKFSVDIGLVASVPGQFTGPASRAYLYYTDELKDWSSGVAVQVRSADVSAS